MNIQNILGFVAAVIAVVGFIAVAHGVLSPYPKIRLVHVRRARTPEALRNRDRAVFGFVGMVVLAVGGCTFMCVQTCASALLEEHSVTSSTCDDPRNNNPPPANKS